MSEATKSPESKGSKDRSPSFPFIPLKTAIERLEAFEKKFGRHPAPAAKAGIAWDMKEKSSQADQTLAALKSFGLVRYDGVGPARHAVLTDEGRNYLRAQQDSVKKQILKVCALRPKIIRKFWATWSADRPPDEVALDTLVLHNGFSDAGARNFLKVYDETTAFAGLSSSDKIEDVEEEEEETVTPQHQEKASRLGAEADRLLSMKSSDIKPPPATAPMLQETFYLDEGPVTLSFPSNMSQASYDELDAALKLFLMRAKRRSHTFSGADLMASSADGKITVFQFKVWDAVKGEFITQPRKSPLKRIMQIGGDVIPGSAEDIDVRLLDSHGRYDPEKSN
jgi:hypothetical protein